MSEPIIMPVKTGTISKTDRAALSAAGVIVVEHPNPADLRLLRLHSEVSGSDLLRCAMTALASQPGSAANGVTTHAGAQREAFVHALVKVITAQPLPPPAPKEAKSG